MNQGARHGIKGRWNTTSYQASPGKPECGRLMFVSLRTQEMPVSGLILSLVADPALAEPALAAVAVRPEFALGQRVGRQVPAAAVSRDDAHARELHDWLMAQPGIEYVDVVCVDFSGDEGYEPPAKVRTPRAPFLVDAAPAVPCDGPPH